MNTKEIKASEDANKNPELKQTIFNRPMIGVGLAQFFSALADNMLLFVLLKIVSTNHSYPDWSDSALQGCFILTYIIFSPIVGVIADHFPKGRVMMFSNSLKLIAVLGVFVGVNPFACYTLAGIGAAVYSPAKFGILSEIVDKKLLVKANGFIEGLTIFAILLGSYLGGTIADKNISFAVFFTLTIYGLAVISNLFIPKLIPAKKAETFNFFELTKRFFKVLLNLTSNKDVRFALVGSSFFWGVAAVLRLMLVHWVPQALGHLGESYKGDNLQMPALLNGLVGVGVIFGSVAAGLLISVENLKKGLFSGIIMGILVFVLSFQTTLTMTIILLLGIGFLGGFFIIPLNTIIQLNGKKMVGVGNAIAIQNFFENVMMILFLTIYGLMSYFKLPIIFIICAFGVLFCLGIIGLLLSQRRYHIAS